MINIKFADTLKDLISEILEVSREELEILKNFYYMLDKNNKNNKIFTRQFMLNLGTDLIRNGTKNDNSFIKLYLNNKINDKEFDKILLDKFFYKYNIKNIDEFILIDIRNEKNFKKYNLKELKEKSLYIIKNFIINNKEILLDKKDPWNEIIKKKIPNDKLSVITDARFKQEFLTFIEDEKFKNRITLALIIKEDKKNNKIVPWIENQGKRIDNEMLYYIYNNATSISELEKNIKEYSDLPPAETFNVILTLFAIKKLNKEELDKTIDKILLNHPIVKKLQIWNFPYGMTQEKIGTSYKIQNYLHTRKDNEILILAGCSGNGKDYVFESIEKLKSRVMNYYINLYQDNKRNKVEGAIELLYKTKFNDKNEIIIDKNELNFKISIWDYVGENKKRELKIEENNKNFIIDKINNSFNSIKKEVLNGKYTNKSISGLELYFNNVLDFNNDIFTIKFKDLFNKNVNPENYKVFYDEYQKFLKQNPDYENNIKYFRKKKLEKIIKENDNFDIL